jgi:hypothetical protein
MGSMETRTLVPPRPFLTVKEVMVLMGCKEDKAYKIMRKINTECG